jgi:hypothetical protein
MWKARRLTTVWASTACCKDSCTSFYLRKTEKVKELAHSVRTRQLSKTEVEEVKLFLCSRLVEGAHSTHGIGAWMSKRAGLDAVKRTISSHCRESNLSSSGLQLVA